MKKMSKETAYNLKTIFGSLVSNNCAIDAGKSFPIWAAIIVFLLGCFLPIIPTMVSICNSNGSSYVTGTYNYSFDKDFTSIALDVYNTTDGSLRHDFVIDQNKSLEPTFAITTPVEQPIEVYNNSVSHQNDLELYYYDSENRDAVANFFTKLTKKTYKIGTVEEKSDSDPAGQLYYSPSFVLLYKKGMLIYQFKHDSTTPVSTSSYFSGDWQNTEAGTKLFERVVTVQGFPIPTSINDLTVDMNKYIKESFENTKAIMDEGYITSKNTSLLYSTLIYEGVYMGLTLFLGLLIFLLTRGKKNMNRYLKILPCMKIAAWTTVAPGILSLALGFLLPNFAVMFFILFEGMRVMWLSMRQLAPSYQS